MTNFHTPSASQHTPHTVGTQKMRAECMYLENMEMKGEINPRRKCLVLLPIIHNRCLRHMHRMNEWLTLKLAWYP